MLRKENAAILTLELQPNFLQGNKSWTFRNNCLYICYSELKLITMVSTTVVLWTFLTVICAARGLQPIEQAKQATHLCADSSDDKLLLVSSANKMFAINLYRKLVARASSKGQNIFFSPLSVSAALAALSVGARGETHQQLFRTLGFNISQLTQSDVNASFLKIIGSMASKISQGTAVFVDNLFTPKPDFLHVLKQWYFTEAFKLDFTNPTESANTINQYVSGMTSGKITLSETLDPSTVLYLLSYVYFKGIWATPFDPKLTTLDLFRVTETTEVPVPMMRMEADVNTYYDEAIATSVLHLPFNNSYAMLLLLPDAIDTLENKISPAHITRWLQRMKQRKYKISVPMFYMKISYKLNDVLTEMGMAGMFGNHANLSGIADGQKLVVSEVVHQATLDVDETGATAATGVGTSFFSLIAPELKFNRPFIVIITEVSAENILFMGKIVNPNI
ncbi:LOW QUALITY PROTEIN: serine protease inhibitor A3K-like [Poeciliopsis prolifica]|uniref:LOW QUALITY PROTEIN: serine protease inhibitor A3K-like n=1 Tax=Poeciliopsis prolifica TaxID=188132 RepID=UPI00241362EC|nr:LOW QUALITY PROTEIN: serine protease inhibitor A3K-like [Poeciliopsis prolifica]